MLRVQVYATHMGGFLGPALSKQGSLFRQIFLKDDLKRKFLLMQMCKWIALLNDNECCLSFCDTLFHFRIIHYFVRLADDIILFAKSSENA